MANSAGIIGMLLARIAESGPMTFAEYMQAALYDPDAGYYSHRAPGRGSDYATSPTLTHFFGDLMGRAFEGMWSALGRPDPFTVLEAGAGSGGLAAAAIASADGPFGESLAWTFVESFPSVAALQRATLAGAAVPGSGRVSWRTSLADGPPASCLVANEVLDNFPVRLFEATEAGVSEVLVGAEDGRLVEVPGPAPAADLTAAAEQARSHLQPGDRFEIRPGVRGWCAAAAAAIPRGYLIVVDYGDFVPDLWTRRPGGTMVTYREGVLGVDPLEAPGECDITAHVDFTDLAACAEAEGFAGGLVLDQRDFLLALGAHEELARLGEARRSARGAEALALLSQEGELGALLDPGGLGALKVLLAARHAPPPAEALGL